MRLLVWERSRLLHRLPVLPGECHIGSRILTHRHLLELWTWLLLSHRHTWIYGVLTRPCGTALWKSTRRRRLCQYRVWHVLLWRRTLAHRKVLDMRHLLRLNTHVRRQTAIGPNTTINLLSSLWVPAFRSRTHQAATMGIRLVIGGIKVPFLDVKHGIGPKLKLCLPARDDGLVACFRKAPKLPSVFDSQTPYPA